MNQTQIQNQLYQACSVLENKNEAERFLLDLLTPAEIEEFANRFQMATLLWTTDLSYAEIAKELRTSTTTVTRVARFLFKEKNQGYALVLEKMYGPCASHR